MHLAFYMGMVVREFGLSGDKGNFQIFIVSADKDYDSLISQNMLETANMTRPKKKENMIHYIRMNAAGNVEVPEDESENILSMFVDYDLIEIDETDKIRYVD